MKLPKGLVDDVRAGRLILFLGAGASRGALRPDGQQAPLGDDLRDLLVEKYLTSSFRNRALSVVAELAISEKTLPEVQDFIAAQFAGLEPTEYHKTLTTFRWRAIATTNYDRLMERAYATASDAAQTPVTILSNEDRVDEKLRSDEHLALLKLHGCISTTHREELPLILTVDQYQTHRRNREYVFRRFEAWAREYSVVFIGHRLEDSDIREILLRVTETRETRPRSFLVAPDLTPIDVRFWEGKKISSLVGTLDDFVTALEAEIPASMRPLLKHATSDSPIHRRFIVDRDVTPRIEEFLSADVEYVHAGMPEGEGAPGAFYRGFGLDWYPIRNQLDVRRRLTDTLLTDVIIRPDEDRPSIAELYVIKAAAGSGKSVLLRRLAWEAATEADVLSLFVRPYSHPSPDDLAELHRVTGQRIFLHWDNAGSHVGALQNVVRFARDQGLPITVITAERINEWNMSCADLSPLVADEFELRRLSESEIETLVRLLEKHDCLGPNLRNRNHEERVEQFVKVAGRRLLVALHEATTGRPLADIIEDEYLRLRPNNAKQLYLTVCVLNRLRTAVRAGLISRVHDIPFTNFKTELFAPLDHVVSVEEHHRTGEYLYRARHPEIAQIVFTRILSNRHDRLNEYLRIIANLNLAFDTDRESFRGLVRARSLNDLFPAYDDVQAIFEKAEEVGSREAYLYQQRANYERIRRDGSLDEAEEYISKARELDPRDDTIEHTLAAVYRAKAEEATKPLVRQRYRDEARVLLRKQLRRRRDDEYAQVTLVKLSIDDLEDLLSQDPGDRELDEAIRQVDRLITDALQEHPDEQYLLTAEADFSSLVADDQRSLRALEKASEANPRDPYVANRLARALLAKDDPSRAREILRTALEANRGDMRLNFQYGEILRLSGEEEPGTLAYHFERSFTPGDRNYEAQFWFARFAFECDDARLQEKSRDTFRALRSAPVSHDRKVQVRDTIRTDERDKVFQGRLDRLEQTYGKIRRDGPGDLIFVHSNQVADDTWDRLGTGARICFAIGFCFSGPTAVGVELLDA